MAVIKVYSRINWLNKLESLTTPLGKTNLNKMDKAINLIDDEVVSMSAKVDEIDTTKVSADQLNNMVTDVSFDDKNGVISITKYNGTVLNIDTAMEKIAVNFEYNAQTQQLILTLENGEKQYIDMSALITQYEFKDTDTIAFSVDSDGKVSASIKSGSITKAMLSSEVMSAITLSENNAAASEQAAAQSATNSELDSKMSQSYAVGKSGIRDGEDTDNSKYYSEQAKKYANEAQQIAGGNFIPKSEKGVANGVAVLNANLAVEKAVADEDGNNIQETYAKKTEIAEAIEVDSELSTTSMNPVQNKVITQALQQKANDIATLNRNTTQLQDSKADKTEVPKLVKVDNKTVFLSEDGVLSAKGGGSSIKPKPVSDVSIATAKSKVTIKWTDPTDIVVDGAVLSQWQKTVLMYKQGTVPPTSLNDGTIAVEETTRNQYQSTGYGISLADGNEYSFSLFAISTDGTSSDKVSVSAKLYATLTVTTEEASLYGKVVTVTSDGQTVTGTFNDSGSVTLRIPWIGSTVVSSTDGTDTTTATVNITEYGKSYNAELSFFKIVTFADGTDEEIAKMVKAHYADKINIADYWAVGDKRKVNLSAMSATGVGESHRAQAVEFAIADFDHDELVTAINGHTKAAVTLTQVDCLMDAECAAGTKYGNNNTENGYINRSDTNVGGWESCARRTWCNSVYYNALPSVLKNAVKEVNKKTSAGNQSTTIKTTTEKIFLLSEIEIFGNIRYSVAGEGNQYQYYKNAVANRYKLPKWLSSATASQWWQRSPIAVNNVSFGRVDFNGSQAGGGAGASSSIAPCFCI